MILLDTNVLSELIKPAPHQHVTDWLDALAPHDVATTSITAAELWYGVRRLPEGRRKSLLSTGIDTMLHVKLGGRIEAFDLSAADQYGDITALRVRQGSPIGIADAQIAAICASRHATLATRNTKDFVDTGIKLINPWEQG
jgi:predicted nucleic acid-binding protein